MQLDITGVCETPDAAQRLEETLRALVTLGTAASARQPELVRLLRQIGVRREDRSVHVALSVGAEGLRPLWQLF